ncbi:MAG: hypothetical protein ACTHP8_22780 [Bosea sp. (in: a-proteobacteria)]|mgnify:CR=1 FL=1|uniref:hypothetical protein n=1 Tax=Bosea sp. (in: a-proteobacteria) TaxID=1871050 RepID=UPI003F7CCB0F
MRTTVRHGPNGYDSAPPVFTLETAEDYQLAKRRIEALTVQDGCSFRERQALRAAIENWEKRSASRQRSPG